MLKVAGGLTGRTFDERPPGSVETSSFCCDHWQTKEKEIKLRWSEYFNTEVF